MLTVSDAALTTRAFHGAIVAPHQRASVTRRWNGPAGAPAGRNLAPINRAQIIAQPRIREAAGRIEAEHFKDRFGVPGAAFLA